MGRNVICPESSVLRTDGATSERWQKKTALAIAALGESGGPQNTTHLQNDTILDSHVSCHIAGAQGDAICSGLGASGAWAGGALTLPVQVLEPVHHVSSLPSISLWPGFMLGPSLPVARRL